MSLPIDLPELTIVRALTGAGPFASGDTLSVAFNSPTVGRLVPHGRSQPAARPASAGEAVLPETISVAIVPAPGGQNLLATATATQGDLVVTQRQTLYLEAPMPGSSVNQQ